MIAFIEEIFHFVIIYLQWIFYQDLLVIIIIIIIFFPILIETFIHIFLHSLIFQFILFHFITPFLFNYLKIIFIHNWSYSLFLSLVLSFKFIIIIIKYQDFCFSFFHIQDLLVYFCIIKWYSSFLHYPLSSKMMRMLILYFYSLSNNYFN